MRIFYWIIVLCLLSTSCTMSKSDVDIEHLEGIQSLSNLTMDDENNYLLVYPSDVRTSQDYTLIKEIDTFGNEVNLYKLEDESFKRFSLHQKPNDLRTLYLSKFGEPILENSFYTYDVFDNSFTEHNIDCFEFETGISHIEHFGDDVYFQTIVTHTTGDQQTNNQNHTFKVSIVNYSKGIGYETEYGYVPTNGPLLELGNELFYATSSMVNQDGSTSLGAIAHLNQLSSYIDYYYFIEDASRYISLYANKNSAYFLTDKGDLVELDKDLNYIEHDTFKEFSNNINYGLSNGTLILDEQRILIELYDFDTSKYYIGILTFEEDVTFMELNLEYISCEYHYKFLYNDIANNCIYLVEMNEDEPYLLIINNHTYELIDKIKVDYPHLLDMVIKRNISTINPIQRRG